MKKNLILAGLGLFTLLIGIFSVVTAGRIRKLGTEPIAPSAPGSKPLAQAILPDDITPVLVCQATLTVDTADTPSPTPSLTPGPLTPTPTTTPAPGPYCDYLNADKFKGSLPLAIQFEGRGYDPVRVKGFRFSFGDGQQKEFLGLFGSSQVQKTDYTYPKAGVYQATLEIMDNGDHWLTRPECEVTITVTGSGEKTTPQPTPTEAELPQAGIKIPALAEIIIGFLLISIGAALVF